MSSCDTCGDQTDEAAVVMTILGASTGSKYTECPPCAIERGDDEQYGAKVVSIGRELHPQQARLSYGLTRSTTTWADGVHFRTRQWGRVGESGN